MAKILDKLLLFIFSLSILILSVIAILYITEAVPFSFTLDEKAPIVVTTTIVISSILILLSIRFFYVSIRRSHASVPSIDQRTEYGDIQISLETIEHLTYKAASRVRGVKEVKTRIRLTEAGLEISVRALVDGETPIPPLSEEVQKQVHDHVGEITGIPVSFVSVYIANLVATSTIKSRVE